MLPFIEVFGHQISMYALCIAAGMAVGILVALIRKEMYKGQREDILFASFYGILGVIAGGKILYLLTIAPALIKNFREIFSDMNHIKALLAGGFVFYGGFLGALGGIFLYAKQYKLDAVALIERIAPSVPLIHAFGRIGCFCAGCCYGRPFSAPVGILFLASDIAPRDVHLFPVQLVEAGCCLIIFLIMYFKYSKRETRGEALAFYMLGYGVIRFGLEFLRYDRERGFVLGLSVSQWISIAIIAAAGMIFFRVRKAGKVTVEE